MWRTEPKSISNSLLMAGQCCHSNMKTVTRACFSSTGGLKATQTCILFGFHFLILQFTTGLYRICQKDIHYRISKPHSNIFKWPRAKRETTKTAFSVKLETLFKKKKIPGTRQLINLQNSKPITEEPHHRNTTNGVQRRTTVLHNVQSISNLLPDLATVQSMLELQKPSMHFFQSGLDFQRTCHFVFSQSTSKWTYWLSTHQQSTETYCIQNASTLQSLRMRLRMHHLLFSYLENAMYGWDYLWV